MSRSLSDLNAFREVRVENMTRMYWRRLNQPLTARTTLQWVGVLVLIALCCVGGAALRRWHASRPQSPDQVRRTIYTYLQDRSRKKEFKPAFDLELKAKIQLMQSNLTGVKTRLGVLQSNLPPLLQAVGQRHREIQTADEQLRRIKRQLTEAEANLDERQRRLAQKQAELSIAQTNLAAAAASRQAVAGQVASNQVVLIEASNAVSWLQDLLPELKSKAQPPGSNAQAAKLEFTAAQSDLVARQQFLTTATRSLSARQADLATRTRAFEKLGSAVSILQTNLAELEKSCATKTNECAAHRLAITARIKELESLQNSLASAQKSVADCRGEIEETRKTHASLQKETALREQELARMPQLISQQARKAVSEAGSYERLYEAIGQHLRVAEQWLAGPDPALQRQALVLASEARTFASDHAEDLWLAARICEGYLLAYLQFADLPGKPKHYQDDLLQACCYTFQGAAETNLLLRSYRTLIDQASNPARSDAARLGLANVLEQTGHYQDAAKYYAEVQHTNYVAPAQRRLTALQPKLAGARPAAQP